MYPIFSSLHHIFVYHSDTHSRRLDVFLPATAGLSGLGGEMQGLKCVLVSFVMSIFVSNFNFHLLSLLFI